MIDKVPVDKSRVRLIGAVEESPGPVIYWTSRDQRAHDNWALLFALEKARILKVPLAVVFCLVPEFLGATLRQYAFMVKGLQEASSALNKINIPLILLRGKPEMEIVRFLKDNKAGMLVTDFSPLKIKRAWRDSIAKKIRIPLYEVDAHNIIPAWVVSNKQEYAAYTIRPKIKRLLGQYLTEFPKLSRPPVSWNSPMPSINWEAVLDGLKIDRSVSELTQISAGEKAARKRLRDFLNTGLPKYDQFRNDPAQRAQSGLSPYLHFGQISAQRVAWEVMKSDREQAFSESFLEELIVRRELAENYCLYNSDYDRVDGFPAWAQETLRVHSRDKREYIYSRNELETGRTHDQLWNAAQKEMVYLGKMHGYMRMYWAKKILEWSPNPSEALEAAVYLNDKYELDGRDPNGYAGIAWSIGGVHDRAWSRRKVFGKIRYMNYDGCRRKFDITAYIDSINREVGDNII